MSNPAQVAEAAEISNEEAKNDVRLKELTSKIESLGRDSASSALSKPFMALAVVKARMDGVIGEEDARLTYMTYLKGRMGALKNKKSLGLGAGDTESNDANSINANVSKNKSLIVAAGLPTVPDFHSVLSRAVELRQEIITADDKARVKPAYDVFVDLARKQKKLAEGGPLNDEQIEEEIRKPEKADKTTLDLLTDDYKRMRKRMEDMPDVEKLIDVVALIADAITSLGGELPPVTDEEKKIAKANKILAGIGYKVNAAAPDATEDAPDATEEATA